jgi:D-alanyl-D-alanine carboxypeptidase (penicillin-binding protein 5/6)
MFSFKIPKSVSQVVSKAKTLFFLAFVLAILSFSASAQEMYEMQGEQDEVQKINVTARSFVIMDAQTGRILLSFRPHLQHPPASTLKVITALYVMEKLDMNDLVEVSRYAAEAPASKIYIKPGELYTVRELMYALLLSSANDGARALAERVSGSESDFAQELTWQARQWGAYDTVLATANGLPAKNQYSTAHDMALLFRMAMQNPALAEIMETRYYDIKGGRKLRNHNRFLFTLPIAVGGKTGYTIASRHTYVGMFRNEDKEIIISLMGSGQSWTDLRTLIEVGFDFIGAPVGKIPASAEQVWHKKRSTHHAKAVKHKTKKRAAKKAAVVKQNKKKLSAKKSAVVKQNKKKSSAKKSVKVVKQYTKKQSPKKAVKVVRQNTKKQVKPVAYQKKVSQ